MANYAAIEPQAQRYAETCIRSNQIDPALFSQMGVKRGLRDLDGSGVLTGASRAALRASRTSSG